MSIPGNDSVIREYGGFIFRTIDNTDISRAWLVEVSLSTQIKGSYPRIAVSRYKRNLSFDQQSDTDNKKQGFQNRDSAFVGPVQSFKQDGQPGHT